MGKTNNIPLHKRAHYRKVREAITEIAKYENINIHNYDLFNIRAYDTVGESQAGKNVSYNTDSGRSIFVEDNKYDIFEVPKKTNQKGSCYGEFLFFIHNTSYDYYLLGIMKVVLDQHGSKSSKVVTENFHYKNYGKYMITYGSNENNITKLKFGSETDPGYHPSSIHYTADSFNVRKHSYNTSNHKILRNLGVDITSTKKITDNKAVKVYKNKKGNNNKKYK